MIVLSLLCLAVTTSAFPATVPADSKESVVVIERKSADVENRDVEVTIIPYDGAFKADNGIRVIPPAPQLSPLYVFMYNDLMFVDPNDDKYDRKENEQDKESGQEKDTKGKAVLLKLDIPVPSVVTSVVPTIPSSIHFPFQIPFEIPSLSSIFPSFFPPRMYPY